MILVSYYMYTHSKAGGGGCLGTTLITQRFDKQKRSKNTAGVPDTPARIPDIPVRVAVP